MNTRITTGRTALQIEQEKWPAAPGANDVVELATCIAGTVWQIHIQPKPAERDYDAYDRLRAMPAMSESKRIVRVAAHRVHWDLPKLLAVAHAVTCVQNAYGTSEAGQLLIEQLANPQGKKAMVQP